MKIKTNIYSGLEIDVRVKGLEDNEHYNEEDAMAFLNWLSGIARNAGYHYEKKGYNALEEEAQKFADILYDALDEKGYYDNLRGRKEA